MAQTFKNATASIGTVATDLYTVPAATTAIVIGAQVANVGTVINALDFYWVDDSATGTAYLGSSVQVPVNAAYEPIGGKLVLEAGDKIVGIGANANELEATISVLELT